MAAKRKYFSTRNEALQALLDRDPNRYFLSIFKMPKGSRHSGMYAVCSDMEYLNTY